VGSAPERQRTSCEENIEQTDLKAKALLRAYSCRATGNLQDCGAQMGLGAAGAALLGTTHAAKIASKLYKQRNPQMFACKKSAINKSFMYTWILPMANANASDIVSACIPQFSIDKAKLEASHEEALNAVHEEIKNIEQRIKEIPTKPMNSAELDTAQRELNSTCLIERDKAVTIQKSLNGRIGDYNRTIQEAHK
jgi:hypothetical protein